MIILLLTLLLQSPTEDLLRQMKALGEQAARLLAPAGVVVRPTPATYQAVISAAVPGTTIELEPGTTYGSATVPAAVHGIIITSRAWDSDTLAKPTDVGMATIQGSPGESFGLLILGSDVTVRGIRFLNNQPSGQGEMIRIGNSEDPVVAHVPNNITLRQLVMMGNPGAAFGQKRAIAANGSHVLVWQSWIEDIWVPGQDSQCMAVWSTPGPVTFRGNVCSAASENVIIGGTPPAGPGLLPEDVLVEDNVLWKPLAWKGATPAHVVKNLAEIKFGHRITYRHNWMGPHWQQAQPGPAVVFTMATNGPCSYCDGQDWTFENNIVWDVSAGISITGYQYSYAPGAGQAVRFKIVNNLFKISKAAWGGNGRPLITENEPKDILVDHNTFIHDATAFVAGDYGTKWPYQQPPLTASVKAGPVVGFVFTNNALQHGQYGLFTPEGNTGANFTTYFPGIVLTGNVVAGASAATIAKYNAAGGGNTAPSVVDFLASLNTDYCAQLPAGVDCSKLPFNLRFLVPNK